MGISYGSQYLVFIDNKSPERSGIVLVDMIPTPVGNGVYLPVPEQYKGCQRFGDEKSASLSLRKQLAPIVADLLSINLKAIEQLQSAQLDLRYKRDVVSNVLRREYRCAIKETKERLMTLRYVSSRCSQNLITNWRY